MSNFTFEQDIINLLLKKHGGHVQKWLYADIIRPYGNSGSGLWHDFVVSNKNYYPINKEAEIISSLLKQMSNHYDTVVDFGIGNESAINKKTIPILNFLNNPKKYTAIDISSHELECGTNHIRNKFKNIEIQMIEDDFYKPHHIEGNHKLGLFLGATISNQDMMVGEEMPYSTIVKRLKTLKEHLIGNGNSSILISIDSNPDLDHALASYQHPSWSEMMTGIMYDVESQLKPEGDFQPKIWEYDPVIDNKNHVIQQVISPSEDQCFSINGQEINIKKGNQFVVKNNFKYPIDLFKELIEEAGLVSYKKPIKVDNNPMCIIEASVQD